MSNQEIINLWCIAMGFENEYVGNDRWNIIRGNTIILQSIGIDSFVFEKYTRPSQ